MVVGDKGIVFENFVAVSLLKHIYGMNDYKGIRTELKYIRTKEGKEIDFCIAENNNAKLLIETKYSDKSLNKSLMYFSEKYNIPALQLVYQLRNEILEQNISIRKAESFLKELFL